MIEYVRYFGDERWINTVERMIALKDEVCV